VRLVIEYLPLLICMLGMPYTRDTHEIAALGLFMIWIFALVRLAFGAGREEGKWTRARFAILEGRA
jgi:hypothetical protein